MTSKLAQMQAKFQQKQMQEKEEKLLKLYENQQQRAFERVGRGSAGSNASTTSIGSTGGGKVRQMFDERRQKAGVDKSYPLEPLKTTKTITKTPSTTSSSRTTIVKSTVVSQVRNGKAIVNQKVYNNNYRDDNYEEHSRIIESYDDVDGHNNLIDMMNTHNLADDLDSEEMPRIGFREDSPQKQPLITGKLANVGGKLPSQKVEAKPKTNVRNEVIKQTTAKKSITKAATPPRSSSSVSSSASSQSQRNSPARSTSNNIMTSKQTRAPTNTRPSSKQTAKSPVIRDDLGECRYCGRRFATDRIGVHEDICGKTGKKKRKAYDATKHRVLGTELESYVMRSGKKAPASKVSSKQSASKGNWRRTHEEFIAAIRAAKQAQAYVAKGGKLTDLPPPPPSSNPDYVQCPHCGRKFNESAAERHIPKCATFQFNKPKNGGTTRSGAGKR